MGKYKNFMLKCTICKVPTLARGTPFGEADDKCITTVFVDTRLWKMSTSGNVSKISVNFTSY